MVAYELCESSGESLWSPQPGLGQASTRGWNWWPLIGGALALLMGIGIGPTFRPGEEMALNLKSWEVMQDALHLLLKMPI